MNLVYDVDAVFKECGSEADLVLEVTDVINAVIARRVHLDNVGSDAAVYRAAGLTPVAGIAVSRRFAVYGLGKYLGTAGLSRSSGAAEKVRVGNLVVCDLVFKDIGYSVLAADVIKISRTPLAVQSLIICHVYSSPRPTTSAKIKGASAKDMLINFDASDRTIHPTVEYTLTYGNRRLCSEQATLRHTR